MLTKAELFSTEKEKKKNSYSSSHLPCLFVCLHGRRESLQPRQFRPKKQGISLGPVFHSPVVRWYFRFASLSSYIDRSREKWSIQDNTSKKHIFQNNFKNNYKTATTTITSPCSVLSPYLTSSLTSIKGVLAATSSPLTSSLTCVKGKVN